MTKSHHFHGNWSHHQQQMIRLSLHHKTMISCSTKSTWCVFPHYIVWYDCGINVWLSHSKGDISYLYFVCAIFINWILHKWYFVSMHMTICHAINIIHTSGLTGEQYEMSERKKTREFIYVYLNKAECLHFYRISSFAFIFQNHLLGDSCFRVQPENKTVFN